MSHRVANRQGRRERLGWRCTALPAADCLSKQSARKGLENGLICRHFEYMKTVTYPLRMPKDLYERVEAEAQKRRKKLSEVFRDLISYGFEALPPMPDTAEAVADTWEKLGPAPDIDYAKLSKL